VPSTPFTTSQLKVLAVLNVHNTFFESVVLIGMIYKDVFSQKMKALFTEVELRASTNDLC
jgi:hypothetical protein